MHGACILYNFFPETIQLHIQIDFLYFSLLFVNVWAFSHHGRAVFHPVNAELFFYCCLVICAWQHPHMTKQINLKE